MSRTARYKLGYLVTLILIGLVSLFMLWAFEFRFSAILITILVLLIPGRVHGVVYRDLFRGGRLIRSGQTDEATRFLKRFLETIRKQQWRKNCIWLGWPVYTNDIEAMALNNIGTIHLSEGRFPEAETCFNDALGLDSQFPNPHLNLAILYEYQEKHAASEAELAEAQRLGHTHGTSDRVAQAAAELLAKFEGRF